MLFSMPGYDRMLCTAALMMISAIVFLPFDGLTHSCEQESQSHTSLFFPLLFFKTKIIEQSHPQPSTDKPESKSRSEKVNPSNPLSVASSVK
jgi:hypothetical protein